MEHWLIRAGAIGGAFAALCCFTPALVILLGIAGLSAWNESIDVVTLPALALSLAFLAGGMIIRRRRLMEKYG